MTTYEDLKNNMFIIIYMSFLKNYKDFITPEEYLKTARRYAKKNNYDPKKLEFANDKVHKLIYDGKVKFGSCNNLDFIIYQSIDKNLALMHRDRYLKRTEKIRGDWAKNPLSKNNMSRKIIWMA
jgi:hypothetical protein